MKKKLFSILLTLAMVVAMIPMMTLTAFGSINTIGDVLDTVKGFPTTTTSTPPEGAWTVNGTKTCYKDKTGKTGDSNNLFFYGFTTLLALIGAGFVYGLRRKEEK